MYSDMFEWDLKELQNRVRENLASTIYDVRKVFSIWRVSIPVPQVRARVWAGEFSRVRKWVSMEQAMIRLS